LRREVTRRSVSFVLAVAVKFLRLSFIVSDFRDVAMMREAIQQHGRHRGIVEYPARFSLLLLLHPLESRACGLAVASLDRRCH